MPLQEYEKKLSVYKRIPSDHLDQQNTGVCMHVYVRIHTAPQKDIPAEDQTVRNLDPDIKGYISQEITCFCANYKVVWLLVWLVFKRFSS